MPEAATVTNIAERTEPVDEISGMKVYDLEHIPDKLSSLFFGTSGAGKTFLIGTASEVPSMLPLLYINFAGGPKTLKANFPDAVANRSIRVLTPPGKTGIDKWTNTEKILDGLRLKGGGGYKTLAVDLASEAYSLCMEWWLAHEKKKDPDRDVDLPGAAGGKDDFGRDWRKALSIMRKMVRGYQDLGMHVIFTAHDKDERDKTSPTLTLSVPEFPGQAVKDLCGFFDEVYYVYSKERREGNKLIVDPDTKLPVVDRWIQCQPTNVRPMCKSRGNLPFLIQNPTIKQIIELAHIPV